MEGTGFDDTTDDNLDLPKMGDLSILQPETRTRGRNNKLYHLSSPYVYALAKWAAVIRYQDYLDPIHKSEAARCHEGEPRTCKPRLSLPLPEIVHMLSAQIYQADKTEPFCSSDNIAEALAMG